MVLFLNLTEIVRRGLIDGQRVTLKTVSRDDVVRRLVGLMMVAPSLPAGCCGAHYPEANPLMPFFAHDAQSGTPAAKAIPVRSIADKAA